MRAALARPAPFCKLQSATLPQDDETQRKQAALIRLPPPLSAHYHELQHRWQLVEAATAPRDQPFEGFSKIFCITSGHSWLASSYRSLQCSDIQWCRDPGDAVAAVKSVQKRNRQFGYFSPQNSYIDFFSSPWIRNMVRQHPKGGFLP